MITLGDRGRSWRWMMIVVQWKERDGVSSLLFGNQITF